MLHSVVEQYHTKTHFFVIVSSRFKNTAAIVQAAASWGVVPKAIPKSSRIAGDNIARIP